MTSADALHPPSVRTLAAYTVNLERGSCHLHVQGLRFATSVSPSKRNKKTAKRAQDAVRLNGSQAWYVSCHTHRLLVPVRVVLRQHLILRLATPPCLCAHELVHVSHTSHTCPQSSLGLESGSATLARVDHSINARAHAWRKATSPVSFCLYKASLQPAICCRHGGVRLWPFRLCLPFLSPA
ncbi:hypothetical protein BC628DRAFT_1015660 [Trametes gibbosa]|nr:hypothetical protein BC628DRAFT_1015660 [Trametes gibbosa]